MKKRILSLLLCAVMLLALVPTVFATNPFTDVKETDYFYDPVLWAVENGITIGISADKFGPNVNCTRAQVVTFLWRANGSLKSKIQNPFVDVKRGDYYYDAVLWAVEEEITSGTSANTFSPDAFCTRAQVVTFLWRSEGAPEPNTSGNPFMDIDKDDYFYRAVIWAVENRITNGLSANDFGPNATCTRGQIVTFLYRSLPERDEYVSIRFQPEDYYMSSSQEIADFLIHVKGGSAPYTFTWTVYYDDIAIVAEPVVSETPIHVFSANFSDYDFDEYNYIMVGCRVEDANGHFVLSDLAFVYPYFELSQQPEDHYMTSSQEDAEFTVAVAGASGPYKYQWVISYDNEEVWLPYETSHLPTNTLTYNFSDYDFDDHREIGVYCVVTNSFGIDIWSDVAAVYQNDPLYIVTQPEDYQMTSSMEDASFTVEIAGGVAEYSYQWVICYDNKEVLLDPILSDDKSDTLVYSFSDYDFDDYHNVGVYCIITDYRGVKVTTDLANICQKVHRLRRMCHQLPQPGLDPQ